MLIIIMCLILGTFRNRCHHPAGGADFCADRPAARHRYGAFRGDHRGGPGHWHGNTAGGYHAVRYRGISGVTIGQQTRKIVPFLIALILGLMVLAYVPFLSTFLPDLLSRRCQVTNVLLWVLRRTSWAKDAPPGRRPHSGSSALACARPRSARHRTHPHPVPGGIGPRRRWR